MRKKVVGEDYVANALEKGKSDFMRPLQQFATVCVLLCHPFLPPLPRFAFQADREIGKCLGNNLDSTRPLSERQKPFESRYVDCFIKVD